MKPPSHRLQHGTWTVGRMSVRPPCNSDAWVVDYVLGTSGELRAVTRCRPGRGSRPAIHRVLEEAITSPRKGRPHLPKRLELSRPEIMREVGELPLPVELGMSSEERKTLDTRVLDAISTHGEYIESDGRWYWLQPGVEASFMNRMFDASFLLATSFAWYTLTGQEAIAVHFPERRQTRWLRLATRMRIDHQLEIALHIAPNEATFEAWKLGELGTDTIVIACVDQDDLPVRAWEECCRMGRQGSNFCPAVTVGAKRRMPSPSEMQQALEGLHAFNSIYASAEPLGSGLQLRTLPNGEDIRLEHLEPELTKFPHNDGGIRVIKHDELSERNEDREFVEQFFLGTFMVGGPNGDVVVEDVTLDDLFVH